MSRRTRKRAAKGQNYAGRTLALKGLGYATYAEYLASNLWVEVKQTVFKCKGKACMLCGGEAYTVHHNRYHVDDLTGKRMKYLQPICRGCHLKIEFAPGGRKRMLLTAKSHFTKRRKTFLADGRAEARKR